MLSWAALSWVELSSVTLIALNWNAELSCVELGIWQGLHWLITDDNWGIPLGASAMTVDASEVAQRSLFGDYYWTMWSLFNSTIEQCEVCSIVQSLDNLKLIRFQISSDGFDEVLPRRFSLWNFLLLECLDWYILEYLQVVWLIYSWIHEGMNQVRNWIAKSSKKVLFLEL